MSLKCSIFGCDYGDSEVEREREEEGSEVVITITETETCKRCGETRVVSENKEVTALETAADIVAEDLEEDSGTDSEHTHEESVDATEPVQEAESEQETPDPDEEDAVILDEDDETVDRDPGEWPDDEETAVSGDPEQTAESGDDETGEWPDDEETVASADTAQSTEPGNRDPGEWPDEPSEGDDDWKPSTELDTEEDKPSVEPTGSAVTVPEGEFRCPECEYTTDVESSSLRAGDFCPECHRGSLEHVTES